MASKNNSPLANPGNTSDDDPVLSGISFPISCGLQTQALFNEGIRLLHNMMYLQAQDVFQNATEKDSDCAMLYWGIAMTQFHPKWPGNPSVESLARGANAVSKAQALSSDSTDRENSFVDAAAAYYEDWQNTNRTTRKSNWREAQANHSASFPDDDEAQIFHHLARLTTVDPYDKTYAELFEVAQDLEEILKRRPAHPGVLHYLLHAYDNPAYASYGEPVARAYEAVAPDAPHALHMPSHIHVRLGNWDEVIAWNLRSGEAALRQPTADDRVSRHYLHALDYRIYGYLQKGSEDMAFEAASNVDSKTPWQLNSGPGAYALAAIPARIAIERQAWGEAAKLEAQAIPYAWDAYPWAEAVTWSARGLGAARAGDLDRARQSIDKLNSLIGATENGWWKGRIEIGRDVVASWIAYREGNIDLAESTMRTAATKEAAAGKHSVEPGHVIYALEQLGDLMLELDRPDQALQAYNQVLESSPGRLYSLDGVARATGLPNH